MCTLPVAISYGYAGDVWSDAYRRAQFIRPLGPFPYQSAHYLKNALVLGFRVDRNLCCYGSGARKESLACKIREIRYTCVDLGASLVFGHFLLVAFKEEVRCYDLDLDALDSNSGASILYRPTDTTLRSFHCVSAIDVDGRPFACAVVNEATQTGSPTTSIYSLKVAEPPELTLDLLYQFERRTSFVDFADLGPRILVIRGGVPVLGAWIAPHLVALDMHAHTCFLLRSCTQMWDTPEISKLTVIEDIAGPTSILTSTHVLLAGSFYTNPDGYYTHVQAFALPHTDPYSRSIPLSTPLSSSHRGMIPGIVIPETALLHHVVDASTQDVLIIIGVNAFQPSRPRYLFQSTASFALVPPVGTRTITSSVQSPSELGSFPFFISSFPRPSIKGTGRAFYTFNANLTEIDMVEYYIRGNGGIGSDPRTWQNSDP